MKRMVLLILTAALLLTLTACGARQEPLETWPISFNDSMMGIYAKPYDTVDSMLAEEHIIFHGKAVSLVEEKEYGVILELEPIDTTGDVSGNIYIRQMKNEDFLLKRGEEAVLILHPGYGDGIWEVFNDTCGMFRIDEKTGDLTGVRLDSLLESVPQTYSAKGGKDLTLEQVYDLLVELDNSGE